jgi:hypothetical protein
MTTKTDNRVEKTKQLTNSRTVNISCGIYFQTLKRDDRNLGKMAHQAKKLEAKLWQKLAKKLTL